MGSIFSSGNRAPRVENYEENKVYFFTFPSLRCCPNASPFALKVETWLRWKSVDYSAIRGYNHWSAKGQIPFVELNGEEINDSSDIIRELGERLNKAGPELTEDQASLAHMVEVMVDNHTVWSYSYYRILGDRSDQFFQLLEGLSGLKKMLMPTFLRRDFRGKMQAHGIGRNTEDEIYGFGCEDIRALSGILGDKNFLLGDEMTDVDCAMFGHLAQIWFLPLQFPHKTVLEQEAKNLVAYLERIKAKVWPDWDKFCEKNLQPN